MQIAASHHCSHIHTLYSPHLEQVARALLENKADPEKQTSKGFTALMVSAQNGHDQVRKSQFEYVDSCRQSLCAQFHTLSSHHLEQAARAPIEAKADLEAQQNEGWTALMYSAQNGHEQVARALLEAGADRSKEVTGYAGWTALKLAERAGHTAICSLLRE